MIPELGHFSLILALMVAGSIGFFGLAGGHTGKTAWLAYNKPASRMLWVLIVFSFLCLLWAFQQNDFSVAYVANQSHTLMPPLYRLSASWGGHEGSLLLWLFMLTSWMTALTFYSKQLPERMLARSLGVLALICVGFLLFTLLTSSPFTRLLEPALEGRGLNPMLQDPGLIFHPPLLYMGYVGFSVPFAFAISALLSGHMDSGWARWSRPWTLAAWIFLTVGIALGSYWAYYELGWGGWWFWDPVENASFMPWLIGTALLHSLAITEQRGLFKNWTLILAITSFSLSLLGTFLVRSGVLTSVHAFAADPSRGIFILAFLAVVVGASLVLYALRAKQITSNADLALVSKETLLLANNVLLSTSMASVFLGTLYPLIVDAMQLGKLSVGPPYFNAVFVPLMIPIFILIGFVPVMRWKQDSFARIFKQVLLPMAASIVLGISLPFLFDHWSLMVAVGLACAAWIILTAAQSIVQRRKNTSKGNRLPLSFYGMHLAHIGLAVTTVGITLVMAYETENDLRMEINQTTQAAGYEIKFLGVTEIQGPNYTAQKGKFEVTKNKQFVEFLEPEKRQYVNSGMPMTEAAIDSGFTRDVYVSLGSLLTDQKNPAWSVRVYYKPFVNWIWWGTLLMAIGGITSMLDKRYRKKKLAQTQVANSTLSSAPTHAVGASNGA